MEVMVTARFLFGWYDHYNEHNLDLPLDIPTEKKEDIILAIEKRDAKAVSMGFQPGFVMREVLLQEAFPIGGGKQRKPIAPASQPGPRRRTGRQNNARVHSNSGPSPHANQEGAPVYSHSGASPQTVVMPAFPVQAAFAAPTGALAHMHTSDASELLVRLCFCLVHEN